MVAQQERPERLREHVLRADRIPDLAAHLLFLVARLGHAAEVAVGDVLDLVVVVEDHLVVPHHAEVLPQHVAGEDVGRHQVLDGVAVFDDRVFELRGRGVLQVDVQRDHPALDVDVLEDDLQLPVAVAVRDLQQAGRELLDLGDQLVRETRAREGDVAELQRVGHAPDAVVLLDEQVLALDEGAAGVLLRRVVVLDELEDKRVARQVEHQHHHALDARRDAETVGRVAQVELEVAEEQRLALLLQAERVVDLAARLPRHHRAQELHIGRGDLHLDQEVGPHEAEQPLQVVLAEERGVDVERAVRGVQDRQRERRLDVAVDDLADDVGALVAEEQRRQHLELEVGAQPVLADGGVGRGVHVVEVALEVLPRALQVEAAHDLRQRLAQRRARRIPGAEGRLGGGLVVLDVLGGHRRAHEDEVVVEVVPVQDVGGDRVEEGLGEFGLAVVGQQADVVQFDLLPDVHAERAGLESSLQPLDRFLDPQVVELDALALGTLLAVPVGALEAVLGLRAGLPEEAVVAVESFDQRAGDVEGAGVVELLGEHRAGPPLSRWCCRRDSAGAPLPRHVHGPARCRRCPPRSCAGLRAGRCAGRRPSRG